MAILFCNSDLYKPREDPDDKDKNYIQETNNYLFLKIKVFRQIPITNNRTKKKKKVTEFISFTVCTFL